MEGGETMRESDADMRGCRHPEQDIRARCTIDTSRRQLSGVVSDAVINLKTEPIAVYAGVYLRAVYTAEEESEQRINIVKAQKVLNEDSKRAAQESHCALPDLPNDVIVKVFSQIGSVPFKCKLRLVNKRWNFILRHADSFAASHTLDLNLNALLSHQGISDESGRLFPGLEVSLADLFEKLLPNLKSVTSLRLQLRDTASVAPRVSSFCEFLNNVNPANVQLAELCIYGKYDPNDYTENGTLLRSIDRYQSTLHSLTGNTLGRLVCVALPKFALYPNINNLEMTSVVIFDWEGNNEQMMNENIQFLKVLTERRQDIQLTINASVTIHTDYTLSRMINILESLPKYDECSVKLRLDESAMANLHCRGHKFGDLSWLGAVEDFALIYETHLSTDAFRLLMQLLPGMRRLRSLRFKRHMEDDQFPLQVHGQKIISDWLFNRLITKSPPGVSINIEIICDGRTSLSRHISSEQEPIHFIQRIEQEVVNMNEEYNDYNVSCDLDLDGDPDRYEFLHEHWPDSMCHIRCCLKIEKGGEKLRQVNFIFRREKPVWQRYRQAD